MVLDNGVCDGGFSGGTAATGPKGHDDCDVTDGSDGRLWAALFISSTTSLVPVVRGNVCDLLGEP
jgi:hypothetical protein